MPPGPTDLERRDDKSELRVRAERRAPWDLPGTGMRSARPRGATPWGGRAGPGHGFDEATRIPLGTHRGPGPYLSGLERGASPNPMTGAPEELGRRAVITLLIEVGQGSV